MDLIREYWWLIVIVVVLALAFVLLRPKQKVQLTDSAPVRPHMAQRTQPPEGRGLAGEHAAAASDVTGDILRAPVHKKLDGDRGVETAIGGEIHDREAASPELAHDLVATAEEIAWAEVRGTDHDPLESRWRTSMALVRQPSFSW